VRKCDHCHLSFDEDRLIKDKDLYFCCKGCQGVYHILQDSMLGSFYDKIGNKTLTPPLITQNDSAKFDSKSFEDKYIKKDKNISTINLVLHGIHCSACVWLNEKILYDTDGIIKADINFTNHKATISWQNDKLSLSQIIQKIRLVGYDASAYDETENEKKIAEEKKSFSLKLLIAVFASLNIMMIAVAKYTGYFTYMDPDILKAIHIAEFVLTTPVLFYSGSIFFRGAYFGAKNGIVNMDSLVASGASMAYIYSLFVMFGVEGHSYFDSVTMIITFVLVGKYLETIGKKNAIDTMDKVKAQMPTNCCVLKNNKKLSLLIDEIQVGDIVVLEAGEKAPVDGIMTKGEATFDESSVTGEHKPLSKTKGSKIISGTIVTNSTIQYKATTDFQHSTINEIITTMEGSLSKKPIIEKKANEISKYFSTVILLLSISTFLLWYFILDGGFEVAIINAIAVVIIACPCALALATPMATVIGISKLSKDKIIFKEAKFLETIAKTTTVIFDKTGTITQGKMSVTKFDILDEKAVDLIYSLVDTQTHPVSKAVKKFLQDRYTKIKTKDINNFQIIPGFGIKASYNDDTIVASSLKYIDKLKIKHNISPSNTTLVVAINNNIVAYFELSDLIKNKALDIVKYLQKQNIKTIILSGDNHKAVKFVADHLNIIQYKSAMTPMQKAEFIDRLKQKDEIITMIGDGLNDAVALSKADISIAMGSGADISVGISDVVLLDSSLEKLKIAFVHSKQTYKLIKQNLLLSLVYNSLTIPLAVLGYVSPLVAAVSMSLSSLLVVGNSIRNK